MTFAYMSGCQAVAEAVKLAKVNVVAAYPITPQTSIVEGIAQFISTGELKAQMVHVEGEHSAMTACVGASCVGARTFTATSGQGLAYMQEPVFWAAGLRVPIVMAVTNRSLLGPNTIFCDHQDALSHRDSGWLQLYVENCQEALDTILIAYKVAENQEVLLPVMVCLDGFFVSHLYEPVDIPKQELADSFLNKEFPSQVLLDPEDPKLLNVLVPPDYYTEFEYDKDSSMLHAEEVLSNTFRLFKDTFGREYANLETFGLDEAEIVLVCMGSMSGTTRAVVRELRSRNVPIGFIKVKTFRPFPKDELGNLLRHSRAIGVFDRDISFGSGGALGQEVLRSVYSLNNRPIVYNFITGLGGRDVHHTTIKLAIETLQNALSNEEKRYAQIWLDLNRELVTSWGLEV